MKTDMTKEEFTAFFKGVPKAELHLHLEAVIGKDTVRHFLRRRNPDWGEGALDVEMERLFAYEDLNGFIDSYITIQSLYDGVADFDYLFRDLSSYLVRNGISYAEIFAAPSAFIKKGWNFEDMVENYRRNIVKIQAETGIKVRMLIDVSRTFGAENAEKNLQLLLAYRIPEIIGIGLGGSEQKGPAKLFGGVFEKAREYGLVTVAHAGEDVGAESVWDTVNILKAARIGHGISSAEDEELMKTLSEKKIPLEVCPTSNVFTKKYVKSLAEHPIRTFFDKGIVVTLNTDDPLFFGVELLDEYWNAYSEMGFSLDELKKIAENSFEASFLSEEEKAEFKEILEGMWKMR